MSLDDFFKKRDKKKKTKSSKFSTLDTEQLAKNLEATSIQTEEADENFQDTNDRPAISENLDEEWKPFDSEENKDYTGLRINTQTWNDENEESEEVGLVDESSSKPAWAPWSSSKQTKSNEVDDDDEKDESAEKTEVVSNEPKTIAAVLAENTTVQDTTSTETKEEKTTSAPSSGAYIPPSMRARMAAENNTKPSTGAYVPPSMRRMEAASTGSSGYEIPTTSVNYRRPNKSQPNLNDCLEFPSLDAQGTDSVDKNSTGSTEKFEYAKKSGRVEVKNEKESQIHIQNKFATLSSNQ